MDKKELYNNIMSEVSNVVKKILDETFTTFPLNKIKSYIQRKQKELDIVIEEVIDKNDLRKYPQDIKIKEFIYDDVQLYVWSLTEKHISEDSNLYRNIINLMQLIGYKKLSIVTDKESQIDKILFTPNKQNYLDLSFITNTKYFYHICPHYVIDKIKEIGFVPKSKNSIFSYDPRIHFYYDNLPTFEYEHLMYELDKNNKSKGNNHEYDIIKIRIPDNIKFQKDFDSEFGIFTTENIQPKYIEDIKSINPIDDNQYMVKKLSAIFGS